MDLRLDVVILLIWKVKMCSWSVWNVNGWARGLGKERKWNIYGVGIRARKPKNLDVEVRGAVRIALLYNDRTSPILWNGF